MILAGAQEGELPHARSLANADDPVGELEGERRLAYVAFTRAQDELLLLYAADRPSRFIAEAALAVDAEPVARRGTGPPSPSTSRLADRAAAVAIGTSSGSSLLVQQGSPPRPPQKPVALVPVPKRGPDGSIPCSLPGCFGAVRSDFVREVTGGYAGLCPKYERHEELIAENPEYDDLWTELSAQNEQARREWRASQGDSSGRLLDRAIRCSLSGCEGIVKPEYVFDVNGVETGLCPQRSLHRVLARRNPAVADELRGLEATNRAAWIEGTYGSLRTDLLLDGGIPCSVLGCDGIVGRGFIITTEDGEAGICGLSAKHGRLIAEDPEARREFERLQVLELELRRSWSSANGASRGGELDSLDDLPL